MDYNRNYITPPPFGDSRAVAEQTSSVMKRVFTRMFIGLLISAFVALGIASSPSIAMAIVTNQIVFWGLLIAMFAMAIIIPARLMKMSTATCFLLFCLFSALMGAYLSPIFLVYKLGSIAYTFFIAAGMFGAMAVYGYFTKRNLAKMGSFLTMALFGLIIAIIVNIFLKSSGLEWAISIIGILIFTGLTAWDTQTVKQMAAANMEPQMQDKLATMGAMNLYLDFINLFLFLLRFLGAGRD